jgi:bifunctional DNase/RNase
MVEMHLTAVRVELPTNNPVVLLQEVSGARRTLPIFIGAPEATAIAFALQGVATSRPMTHDLFRDVLNATGTTVDRVVITELREGTYYAEMHLSSNGQSTVVSSRPSDAIALAARLGTPIYAEDDLIDSEGVQLAAEEEYGEVDANPDEILTEFRRFIDDVRPEDFSS